MTKGKILKWALSIISNVLIVTVISVSLTNCKTEEPEKENVEESITKITLHFTPTGGGSTISVSAIDPDGDGPQDMLPEGDVNLEYNLEYDLVLEFTNHLENPPVDITAEIQEEGEEHMVFYGWTTGLFFNPSNGDINANRDNVRYQDMDGNALPIGIETKWTTSNQTIDGDFRVVLKHQPDLKSETSTVSTGATDADITFHVVIAK